MAVLVQTPAAYILMYCNAFSTTFTSVRCFQLRKKVLRLDATSYQSSDRTVQHLCLWLQNEHERQFWVEFAPHTGGTNDIDDHACEPNNITVQNKIIAKILPVNKFTTLKFLSLLPSMNGYFFLDYYVLLCNTCLYRSVHRHGHHYHSSPLAEVRIQTGVSFFLIVIYFGNSKTISQLNFERLLVTDFCSNDFSEIPLAYLLYQLKPIPEISVKNISKIFY